jgi:hypothetical protein
LIETDSISVIGPSSSETIFEAILWAFKNHAQVVSMSLGIDFPGYQMALVDGGYPREVATSLALEGYRSNIRMFDRLSNLITPRDPSTPGLIVVAAAGNESRRQRDERYRMRKRTGKASLTLLSEKKSEKKDRQSKLDASQWFEYRP